MVLDWIALLFDVDHCVLQVVITLTHYGPLMIGQD